MKGPEFNKTKVSKWIISDSDGTIVPFVKIEDKEKAKPDKEFIDAIRQQSFHNPEVAFMVLTGRQAWELPAIYENLLLPDTDGRIPKVVLASENGACMQFKHVGSKELNPENRSHKNIVQFAKPLDDVTIKNIENIVKNAVGGEHYSINVKDKSPEIWIKAEVKNYGFTFHTKMPHDEKSLVKYNKAIETIKEGLRNYGKTNDLLVHLDAASALTIEKVSKGATLERIASNDSTIKDFFSTNGLATAPVNSMTYSGDDVGDIAALNVLNKAHNEGRIEGYTSRPSNYTPFDPKGRTPNSPTTPEANNSFFILGGKDKLPQEQHRDNITDTKKAEALNNLRKELSNINLLPSQTGKQDTPPIVLLTTGDIIIQKPEDYKAAVLNNITLSADRKVILVIDNQEELRRAVNKYPNAFISKNVGVAYKGEVFFNDVNNQKPKEINQDVFDDGIDNPIISVDEEVGFQLQYLRAIEAVLIKQKFMKPDQQIDEQGFTIEGTGVSDKNILENLENVLPGSSLRTSKDLDDDDSAISLNTAVIEREIENTLIERFKSKPDVSVDKFLHDGEIDRSTQLEYTMNLFREQSKNTKDIVERTYTDYTKWSNSKDTRARQIFIEAKKPNIVAIATAIVNASPLERITIVGLTDELKKELHTAVKDTWKTRLENNQTLKESFKKANNKTSESDLSSIIDNAPLDKLMGPHNSMEGLDISPESLERNFEHYSSNVEEFIVYGTENALAEQAVHLSQAIDNMPYLTIKQEPFLEEENSLWLLATKEDNHLDMVKLITNGEETAKILGAQVEDNYDNATVSKAFNKSFDEIQDIAEEDKNYLKSIFIEEGIYPPGLSPDAITKMISKATSALGASGAKSVGDALMWNMVNRPVSTAKGVDFAVGSMTLDGGNDLVKEALDKKIAYKEYYFAQLTDAILEGKNSNKAQQQAVQQLVSAYNKVEKSPEIKKEIKAAEKYRDVGLEHSNSVKKSNDAGVKWLKPLPISFGVGMSLTVVGAVLAVVAVVGVIAVAPPVGIFMAVAGAVTAVTAAAATYKSMRLQGAANSNHLPKANVALAIANEKMYAVKQKRIASLDKLLPKKNKNVDALGAVPKKNETLTLDKKLGGPNTKLTRGLTT
jgi:hypothetical protein